jgi:hypothetical protein
MAEAARGLLLGEASARKLAKAFRLVLCGDQYEVMSG